MIVSSCPGTGNRAALCGSHIALSEAGTSTFAEDVNEGFAGNLAAFRTIDIYVYCF